MLATIRAKFPKNSTPTLSVLRNFQISQFKQKVPLYVETDRFILKTAQSPFEVRRALKLRHEIFYKELQARELPSSIDVDGFDRVCDHLLIIDKHSGEIVGTYRLICSLFSKRFYSQGEFELGEVLAKPGVKLELGRACIQKEFRSGAVLNLLWRGVVDYMKATDAQYLFGCASVQTVDATEASLAYEYLLASQNLRTDLAISPTKKYRASLLRPAHSGQAEGGEKLIPPLLHSYLRAGAKVVGLPAYDRDFACFDFFVLLKATDFSPMFRRRFNIEFSAVN